MNTYEFMYIIQSNLSDDETDKANERIAEEIEKRGGAILHRERLGRKRLAYPIRRNDDGAYHLLYFELPPGEIASLRSAYRLHPRLLRILILRREREEIPKIERRRSGPEGPAEETEPTVAPDDSKTDTGESDEVERPDSTDGDGDSGDSEDEPAEDEPERQE